jgi:hypothetical protein
LAADQARKMAERSAAEKKSNAEKMAAEAELKTLEAK